MVRFITGYPDCGCMTKSVTWWHTTLCLKPNIFVWTLCVHCVGKHRNNGCVFYILRICAHQLGFDAGVVALEMARVGFDDYTQELWRNVVEDGFCTMCPTVSKWSCRDYFDHYHGVPNQLGRSSPVGLRDMAMTMVPSETLLINQHHDAEADATLTWKILRELHVRAGIFSGFGN